MRLFLTALSLLLTLSAFSQLNMTLLSQIDYADDGNDIWGWVAPDGTEYAIMGLTSGVSIVSLADPNNAEELFFIPGDFSTWRDIKTWGNYAYVTTDQPGSDEGLLVINMENLPGDIDYYNWTPNLPGMGVLETCHNLWIDEFGICYLSGCNLNQGGILYIDVFSQPGVPQYLNKGVPEYSHDVYVRNNIMYTSEIYIGQFGVYDVTDKDNTVFMAGQETPFQFTHNTWLSDNSEVLFTTDERNNAPIGAYDVSDPDNIIKLDEFRPAATLGSGVIPHNVHVWENYLIISYYTDGGIIVDAARPDNLIEIGNFDTFLGQNNDIFDGAWGAYPYLPSGLVLVSDISAGLFVFDVNYVRGCYLEGLVTNAATGQSLAGVDIEIQGAEPNITSTDLAGEYKTGQATPGTFDVTFSKAGFEPKTVQAVLENGVLTILDVELEPYPVYSGQVFVVNTNLSESVPFAQLRLDGLFTLEVSADQNGVFSAALAPGTYEVVVGAWGYEKAITSFTIPTADPIVVELAPGYEDDFLFDYGWNTESTADAGDWEWVEPQESTSNGEISTPGNDVDSDLGDRCYVTGNGGNGGANDVDNGLVRLTSPTMDLTWYNQPILEYQAYFFNGGGFSDPNDALVIKLRSGTEIITLETITAPANDWLPVSSFDLTGLITLSADMQLIFETSDLQGSGHVVEAAVDAFRIIEGNPTTADEVLSNLPLRVYPNPFSDQFTLEVELPENGYQDARVVLYDGLGRIVEEKILIYPNVSVNLGAGLPVGLYRAVLLLDGAPAKTTSIAKF